MKFRNIGSVLACSMVIGILFGPPVLASESVNNMGSITILNQFHENVEINIAKIGDLQDGTYKLKTEYSEMGIDLNTIQDEQELVNVAVSIEKLRPREKSPTKDQNGNLVAADLTPGVYIVYAAENKTETEIIPSIVSIPAWNEEKGSMDHHVELCMKQIPIIEEDSEIPKTGDSGSVRSYVVMSMISLVLVFYFLLYKKNKIW